MSNYSRQESPQKNRYNKLSQAQIEKVQSVFSKIFGRSLIGHKIHIQKNYLNENLNPKTFNEVKDEIDIVNYQVIDCIIQGKGFIDEKDEPNHFSPNKTQKGHSPPQHSQILPSINKPKLTPEQLRKLEYNRQLMRQRMEDCEEQLEAAQDLIRKLKKEKYGRMERFKQKQQEVEQLQQREVEDILRKRFEDEEKKKKELEKRREQISLKLELMREQRQKRQMDWKQQTRNHSEGNRLLYKEWEDKFKQNVESETLAHRKKILEEIRSFKRPISKQEFEEHQKKYEDEREKLIELRQIERERRLEEQEQKFDVDKFKTRTYQEVALFDLQQREERETKEEIKRLLMEKKDSYAKYVKEMHLPPKSVKKEQELQDLISALHHPVRSSRKYPPGAEMEGMKRSLSKGGRGTSSLSNRSGNDSESQRRKTQQKRTKKNFFTMKPPLPANLTAHDEKPKPKTDYLKERRVKREQQVHEKQNWEIHLNNKRLTKKEKFIKIKEKAREIEEMALRKEQLLNVKAPEHPKSQNNTGAISSMVKDERNIEETLEVNDMLVDAIKAKLAILDNIN